MILPEIIVLSMKYLLVSIGFALCLFGVSPAAVSNPFLNALFFGVYVGAITSFVGGAYAIMRGISAILERTTQIDKEELKVIRSTIEDKLKTLEKKEDENK
jgi:hypothetical protein